MTKLTTKQKTEQIPEAIKRYLSDKNTKQAQLARVSKVSESYISHILQGKTMIGSTEIKDRYYLSICETIGLEIKTEVWGHFNTQNFKQIITQLKEARTEKTRIAIDGDTGAGKTYSCSQYKNRYHSGTYVVKCSAIENSKEFAINIGETVGVKTYGTANAIIKRVVTKLVSLDDAILIIDEAEHIEKKQGYINIIKTLADQLENRVGFALLGMNIAQILQKGYDRNKQNFRQTARRFNKRELCSTDITEDIENICLTIGINDSRIHQWLKNRIQNFGDLENIIKDAFKEAEKIKQPVSIRLLNTLL